MLDLLLLDSGFDLPMVKATAGLSKWKIIKRLLQLQDLALTLELTLQELSLQLNQHKWRHLPLSQRYLPPSQLHLPLSL